MTVYFLHPTLTINQNSQASVLFKECLKELLEHINASPVQTLSSLSSVKLYPDDAIVFFNNQERTYSKQIDSFFHDALEAECQVISIATSKETRYPPYIFEKKQAFDFLENLRNRSLTEDNIPTLALSLARKIITKLQPTLTKDRMNLFISHRRVDGEDMASRICKQLRQSAETRVFRDLIDISVGESAQEVIEKRLLESDAVILIDTPEASTSCWVQKEIKMALSINIPIVWVRVGSELNRGSFEVLPYDTPHFIYENMDLVNGEFTPEDIEAFIHRAFNLSRDQAIAVFDHYNELKSLARIHNLHIEEIDRKNMFLRIRIPRAASRYVQKPITHLVQFYGRRPEPRDIENIKELIKTNDNPTINTFYDSALLVAPILGYETAQVLDNEDSFVDSFDEFLNYIESCNTIGIGKDLNKFMVISGAFPDCEPEYQQHLLTAIHAIVQTLLSRGIGIIFGGHPTFRHIIFSIAERQRIEDPRTMVKLYQSRWFISKEMEEEFSKHSTLHVIEAENNQNASLFKMRKEMIENPEAVGMIVIGGKTVKNNPEPGIDEEINIAEESNMPIFLIGSVGGRSSEIASEYKKTGWIRSNNELTNAENEKLLVSLDYRVLTKMIISNLKL
ncbi:TIR domain-containing protein [Paenibacillus sp. FSL K6-1122]|uniref:SLOG domain-containing protein n=1 Tax=Paenibacillus sp. FSL K6-1122 TaxID=2954512 RepID=UPI0030EFA0CA